MNKLESMFWARVAKTANCWTWIGTIDKDGYGSVKHQGKLHRAHRLSAAIHKLPQPNSKQFKLSSTFCVLHTCHNRCCVNPDHLYAGTRKNNALDAIQRGTHISLKNKGINHPQARLSDKIIRDILHMRKGGATYQDIANTFSIAPSYAWGLCQGYYRSL